MPLVALLMGGKVQTNVLGSQMNEKTSVSLGAILTIEGSVCS